MLELGSGEDDTIGEVSFRSILDAMRVFDAIFEIKRDKLEARAAAGAFQKFGNSR